MSDTPAEFIALRQGPTVPVAAVRLFLDLADRGIEVRIEDDDLAVEPGRDLTDEDRAEIRRWRRHLIALAAYEAPPCR